MYSPAQGGQIRRVPKCRLPRNDTLVRPHPFTRGTWSFLNPSGRDSTPQRNAFTTRQVVFRCKQEEKICKLQRKATCTSGSSRSGIGKLSRGGVPLWSTGWWRTSFRRILSCIKEYKFILYLCGKVKGQIIAKSAQIEANILHRKVWHRGVDIVVLYLATLYFLILP